MRAVTGNDLKEACKQHNSEASAAERARVVDPRSLPAGAK